MYDIQTRIIDGVMYVSTPSVIVKAGVLGKSLLTQTEMEKSLQAWNGVALTMRHPQIDDSFVSVEQAPAFKIGYFDDAVVKEDRIKGRMWLNAALLAEQGNDGAAVLGNIINSIPTEVSTSYFYDKQQGVGQFNGETYEYATLNITPDHIAILPDQNGNCSWQDGCGIPRVNSEDEEVLQTLMVRRQLTINQPPDNIPGDDSMEEQQVNEVVDEPVVEEPVVEVNEESTDEIVEETIEQIAQVSELDAFIDEIGFDAFTGAIRSVISQGEQATNSLVANAAEATGVEESELRGLSDSALRALTINKRAGYAGKAGGLRSNSTGDEASDGWVAYPEVTQ